MNRTVTALAVVALAVGGAGAASAGGNGAQKSGLAAGNGLSPLVCTAAEESAAGTQTENGFVVLNAPGRPAKQGNNARPDGTHKLVGAVVLKGAPAGDYVVRLAPGNGCGEDLGTLTVNEQGNGTFSFEETDKGAGTWHVVLTQQPVPGAPLEVQRYASAPVEVT